MDKTPAKTPMPSPEVLAKWVEYTKTGAPIVEVRDGVVHCMLPGCTCAFHGDPATR